MKKIYVEYKIYKNEACNSIVLRFTLDVLVFLVQREERREKKRKKERERVCVIWKKHIKMRNFVRKYT